MEPSTPRKIEDQNARAGGGTSSDSEGKRLNPTPSSLIQAPDATGETKTSPTVVTSSEPTTTRPSPRQTTTGPRPVSVDVVAQLKSDLSSSESNFNFPPHPTRSVSDSAVPDPSSADVVSQQEKGLAIARLVVRRHKRTTSNTSSEGEANSVVSVTTPRKPSIETELKTAVSAVLSRNEEFRSLFHLPKEETVIEIFSCAVERKILLHGKMFVSQHFVCFFSNVFGHKTHFSIPFSRITKIEKKYSALFVPNALLICTSDQTFFFASFPWRDHAYRMLSDLWDINKKTSKMSALEAEQQISMLANKLREQAPAEGEPVGIESNPDQLADTIFEIEVPSTECDGEEDQLSTTTTTTMATSSSTLNSSESEEEEEEVENQISTRDEEMITNSTHQILISTTPPTPKSFLAESPIRVRSEESPPPPPPLPTQQKSPNLAPLRTPSPIASLPPSPAISSAAGKPPLSPSPQQTTSPLLSIPPLSLPVRPASPSPQSASPRPPQLPPASPQKPPTPTSTPSPANTSTNAPTRKEKSGGEKAKPPRPSIVAVNIEGATLLEEDVQMPPDTPSHQQASEDEIHDDYFHSQSVDDFNFFEKEAPITMQKVIDTELKISCRNLFNIFFSDKSTFTTDFHVRRGDSDIAVGPWTKLSDQEVGRMRDVCFSSPIRQPFGPKSAKVFETHKYVFLNKSKTRLVVQMCSITPHVPYGDTFRLEYKFDIKELPDNVSNADLVKCQMVIYIGIRMLKSTLFKSKIESEGMKEATQSHNLFMDMIRSTIHSLDPLMIAKKHKHKKSRSSSTLMSANGGPSSQMPSSEQQQQKKSSSRRKKASTSTPKHSSSKQSLLAPAPPISTAAGPSHSTSLIAPQQPPSASALSSFQPSLPPAPKQSAAEFFISKLLTLSLRQILVAILCFVLLVFFVLRRPPSSAENENKVEDLELLKKQISTLSRFLFENLCKGNPTDCQELSDIVNRGSGVDDHRDHVPTSSMEHLILSNLERSNTLHTISIVTTFVCIAVVCLSFVRTWFRSDRR